MALSNPHASLQPVKRYVLVTSHPAPQPAVGRGRVAHQPAASAPVPDGPHLAAQQHDLRTRNGQANFSLM